MKKTLVYSLTFLLSATSILSCKKEIRSKKGGIDMISNVYFNASKGLDEMQTIHVAKLNYLKDSILEFVPDENIQELNADANLIIDTTYYNLGENPQQVVLSDLVKNKNGQSVFTKKRGAIFSNDYIPDYGNKRILKDTILFKKRYRRFEINAPKAYTRFYIYVTDTILPYSLYKHVEKDFKGRLERIDSYNKETDVFVTLQIIPRKEWDEEAKDWFAFNQYANQQSTKK